MKFNQGKMVKRATVSIALLIVVICGVSISFVSDIRQDLYLETVQYLTEISSKSAELVKTKVVGNMETLDALATFIGNHETFDIEHSVPILEKEVKRNNFKRMGIILANGIGTMTDGYVENFSDREYFERAMAGERNLSGVLVDKLGGDKVNIFATPIWHTKKIVGVLIATQSVEQYAQLLTVDSFGGKGYSYIIRSDGSLVVYTPHENGIGRFENLFDEIAKEQGNSKMLADFRQNLADGKDGTLSFLREGTERQLNYAKIGVEDWYVISVVPTDVIAHSSGRLIFSMVFAVVMVLVALFALGYVIIYFSRKNSKALEQLAFVDVVTGGNNWNRFRMCCIELFAQFPEKKYALISFDIDKFKIINDVYGHEKGDELLKHVYQLALETLRKNECFARNTADHFCALVEYQLDQDILQRIEQFGTRIMGYMENYTIVFSFGVCKVEDKELDISILLDRADIARVVAKNDPEQKYAFFNETLRTAILADKEIENRMAYALESGEFEVYLQPKYSFSSEKIVGAEALVRWNHPEKGIVLPGGFIPLFEKNGFVKKLDFYMFEQTCILLRRWKEDGRFPSVCVSVNFSRIHLNNRGLANELAAITKKYGIPPAEIEIEITESAVLEDTRNLIAIMEDIKAKGFLVAIDDFGSGYSSLNTLRDLPADCIKLDKGFLDEATENPRGKAIISSLIQMTKVLGLFTVAEGVETKDQVDFLHHAGCDVAQGFYYARPMRVEDFEALMERN